jgi:lipid II:glycine glycyltransferase (peptidoglycan interpeptide bridge formation enzyme)
MTRRENTREALQRVFELHEVSMARRGENDSASREGFDQAQQELLASGCADVFVTYLDDEPVSAYLCGAFNGWATGLIAGSSEAGYKCYAPAQQTWTQTKWYKEHGADTLSLGGAKAHEEGLHKFKRQFGAAAVEQPAGRKVISRAGERLDGVRSFLRKLRGA